MIITFTLISIYILSIIGSWLVIRTQIKYIEERDANGEDIFLVICPIANTGVSIFGAAELFISYFTKERHANKFFKL